MNDEQDKNKINLGNLNIKNKNLKKLLKGLIFLVILIFIAFKLSAPSNFPVNSVFIVNEGEALGSISNRLKEGNYIRSRSLFEGLLILKQNEKSVQEGEYLFEKPTSLIRVILRLSGQDFGLSRIKVTIPEGFNRKEIAQRCAKLLKSCNEKAFLEKTEGLEGYLFPDTYLLFTSKNEDELIKIMQENFAKKTTIVFSGIDQKKQKEIVTLASILEREAANDEDMKIISGILHNRLKINMALQVDATFYFLIGKSSSELTVSDLKIKSPYNTYVNKGLPPGPIGNPGLSALNAALYPSQTDYLYYLHGKDGTPHYAKTHAEHLKNRQLYLK